MLNLMKTSPIVRQKKRNVFNCMTDERTTDGWKLLNCYPRPGLGIALNGG